MFYHYKFWHSLTHPTYFTQIVEKGEITGYKKRAFTVFIFCILLFSAREFWGMGTEGLTTLFAMDSQVEYYLARLLSMVGVILWAILYFCFHYYGVTYFLHIFTEIPYKWIQKVQLYVVVFLLIEKAILFAVFYAVGYSTTFSFFSLAPLAQQIIDTDFVLFAINQLTVATMLTILVQYTFLSKWDEETSKKVLLAKIILLQVIMAIFVGMVSVLPLQEWLIRGLG
ncbi:hypothetical protein AEA09_18025 [Lysinibacillus contaminans]|uniref:Yip1 domain-containing protein n=1 Tax=Lysinibacillus contaminans TaxID=1293441 RepID=A0ABR5JX78_9BACI|nr:hypothetical protein [Lysinibacillus contaminans]KOS66633.1 hypothetical protein AEA09_18025 [Lysinibacillus contaminans]